MQRFYDESNRLNDLLFTFLHYSITNTLQRFDAIGWVPGRASNLEKVLLRLFPKVHFMDQAQHGITPQRTGQLIKNGAKL